ESPARHGGRPERHGEHIEDTLEFEERVQLIADLLNRPEVAADAAPLVRKAFLQAAAELVAPLGDVEPLATNAQVVVAAGVQLAEFEITGDAEAFIDGAHPTAGPQLADVVHPGAEAVSLDREGVAPASRGVVLLEHQRPEAGLLESDGRGEPAGAGADHDHVEVGHAEHL